MRKHPSSFKLCGSLEEENSKVTTKPVVLYEGPGRSNFCLPKGGRAVMTLNVGKHSEN